MEEEKKEQKQRGRSRRQTEPPKKGKILYKVIPAAVLLLAVAAGTGAYLFLKEAKKYETVFFANTTINGIDASWKTPEDVKAQIASGIDGYTLAVRGRENVSGTITKEEINLHSEFDGSLEKILAEQNPKEWYRHKKEPSAFQIETMIAYDEELLKKKMDSMELFNAEKMVKPQDAYISDYDSSKNGYEIIPAVQGTEVVRELADKEVTVAIMSLSEELDLDKTGCYTKPGVEADAEALVQTAATLNKYVGAVVTHTFGGAKEVLDGGKIHEWLSVDGSEVTVSSEGVSTYVKGLASKYNTAYKAKKLKTSYGTSVTVSGGNYGWRISQVKEADEVMKIIKAGEQQTREPEYSQKAASHGANDYGDTYVEINLTAQHMFYYKNGKLITQSDFVSGNEAKGWATPAGAYSLTYKQRDATLTGENYKTPVSYWMPFNGGIGMHDANWRGSFGGSIYKTSGSHGCINLPPPVAKTVYENISSGTPVLCYHLGGTGSGATSAPGESKPAETTAAAAETTAAPAQTTAAPAETTAPAGPSVPAEPGDTQPQTTVASPAETPAAPTETSAAPSQTAAGPGFDTEANLDESSEEGGPGF